MHPSDGRVVSNFIVQALRGEAILVLGAGKRARSFCYVDDLIEGFLRLMDTCDPITGPINLGNPVELTILELAQIAIDLTGSSSQIIYYEMPQDDPKQRKPDTSMERNHLQWDPKVKLDAGLERTISYFDKLLLDL